MATAPLQSDREPSGSPAAQRERIFDGFRRWGHLQARLDPLEQYLQPERVAALEASGPDADDARRCYAGTVGAEFMHIPDPTRRQWIQDRIEGRAAGQPGSGDADRFPPPVVDRIAILKRLTESEIFEQVIQARYPGAKRFSLEGVTVLIPFLDAVFHRAAEHGAVQAIVGMSHRGRLNVMANNFSKSPADIFSKFEDVDPRSVLGGGDVKHHVGATGEFAARNGEALQLHLVSNPSHLEAVDPVTMGRARAKQTRLNSAARVLPVLIHGDAAFAGQGIWAETLNFSGLPGFSVGGSIQVIVNNLIGFTTAPEETGATRYSSDLAKRLPIPIFHVNAEDPEAAVRVAALAVEYRYAFQSDVVIDLIGYRRYGHSEVDDPTITQPLRYARIKDHPALYQIYARRIGEDPAALVSEAQARFALAHRQAQTMTRKTSLARLPQYWSPYRGGRYDAACEVDTGLSAEAIRELGARLIDYPRDFHMHPKIGKLLEQRGEMARGARPVDYGMAEALAFGALLLDGAPVRLSGQDSQRGTFNQRHSVLVDTENERRYAPLAHLAPGQARFEVYNSVLSEAAVLGFEYGYSRDYPETLTLWEAQFGDFANGAQIITDQFIASGEDKWGLLSGVVMLLPHGYEGQGPEHSSARLERFLQLAARDNFQICQPSTAAQYFHLLRRQVMRPWRKPLVALTPKSMLRHADASSPLAEFHQPRFRNVLPETSVENARRLLLCTGKIGHELRRERSRKPGSATGILSVEQLYPWPQEDLAREIARHPAARELVWVQEEPENMGALFFVLPRLRSLASGREVLSVKRSAAASPATGSAKAHQLEQKALLALALRGPAEK